MSSCQEPVNRPLERIRHLYDTGKFSDIKIIVGSGNTYIQIFQVHRVILKAASEKFVTMMSETTTEEQDIVLENEDPEYFEILLRYIYTDQVNLTSVIQAVNVCRLAKNYSLPFLVLKCLDYLIDRITPENACSIYEMAISSSNEEYQLKCWKYIMINTPSIIKSVSFTELDSQVLIDIMKSACFDGVSELELWNSLLHWAIKRTIRIADGEEALTVREVLEPIFPYINFSGMSLKDFLQGPGRSSILTASEKESILKYLLSQDRSYLPSSQFIINVRNPCPRFIDLDINLKCDKQVQISKDFPEIYLEFTPLEEDIYIYGITYFRFVFLNEDVIENVEAEKTILNVTNLSTGKSIARDIIISEDEGPGECKILFPTPMLVKKKERCKIVIERKLTDFHSICYCEGNSVLKRDSKFNFYIPARKELKESDLFGEEAVSHFHSILYWI